MTSRKTPQTMKPATAAKKLDIYLEATPEEFRAGPISREDLAKWETDPPQWLVDLRRDGPHPRSVVAARLRVSNSGLARAGITGALTTDEIRGILDEQPEWLLAEQHSLELVKRDEKRIASQREDRAEQAATKQRDA